MTGTIGLGLGDGHDDGRTVLGSSTVFDGVVEHDPENRRQELVGCDVRIVGDPRLEGHRRGGRGCDGAFGVEGR